MYAIVEIAGLQYKVEKDRQLYVNRLEGEAGTEVTFDRVLLTDNGSVQVGAPVIDGTVVTAKILEHVKGDKVIVFKKKRRKGYRVKNGHRQWFTKIEILSIAAGKAKPAKKEEKKAAPKAEAKAFADVAAEPKEEIKKETPKKEDKKAEPKAEKATPKKEEKKPANPNSDYATVNFSEDHELNYHLRKNDLSQSIANREVLTELGKGLKKELGKRVLTHEEVDELIQKNIKKFEEIKK